MAALLVAAVLFGCGGSGSTETSTAARMYSTGTKLGERGPTPIDPVERSGPLAEEIENNLIKHYEGEGWFPNLEDVWSADGVVLVDTDLPMRSSKSKKTAEEVCVVIRKIKVKYRVKSIAVGYGFNESAAC